MFMHTYIRISVTIIIVRPPNWFDYFSSNI